MAALASMTLDQLDAIRAELDKVPGRVAGVSR